MQDFPGDAVDKNTPTNAGAQVWFLVWEDLTCLGATKPLGHKYWARAPRAHALPLQWEAHVLQTVAPALWN